VNHKNNRRSVQCANAVFLKSDEVQVWLCFDDKERNNDKKYQNYNRVGYVTLSHKLQKYDIKTRSLPSNGAFEVSLEPPLPQLRVCTPNCQHLLMPLTRPAHFSGTSAAYVQHLHSFCWFLAVMSRITSLAATVLIFRPLPTSHSANRLTFRQTCKELRYTWTQTSITTRKPSWR